MPQPKTINCQFCGANGTLQPAAMIPHLSAEEPPLYVCGNFPRCDAYVRCHAGTDRPLGTMANRRLRMLRRAAHREFDLVWQDGGELGRKAAYEAAAHVMDLEVEFHIGDLDEAQCARFIDLISMVQIEHETRVTMIKSRLLPPARHTVDILLGLFHPNPDVFKKHVPKEVAEGYKAAFDDAIRCGLFIVGPSAVALSPRGRTLVFDQTVEV